MTRHVWLAQCLCGPRRHAILAAAGEFDDEAAAAGLITTLREYVADLRKTTINPWCGICGSTAWQYENARTRWRTMAEANAELEKTEAGNIAALFIYGSHGPKPPGSA